MQRTQSGSNIISQAYILFRLSLNTDEMEEQQKKIIKQNRSIMVRFFLANCLHSPTIFQEEDMNKNDQKKIICYYFSADIRFFCIYVARRIGFYC